MVSPVRIATHRVDGGFESIEMQQAPIGNVLFYVGDDKCSGFSFPVDIDFVAEFFSKIGRTFDLSKLPKNTLHYPYSVNL